VFARSARRVDPDDPMGRRRRCDPELVLAAGPPTASRERRFSSSELSAGRCGNEQITGAWAAGHHYHILRSRRVGFDVSTPPPTAEGDALPAPMVRRVGLLDCRWPGAAVFRAATVGSPYHQVTTKQTAEDAESRRQPVRWKSAWFIWATAMIRLCLEGNGVAGGGHVRPRSVGEPRRS
jgi:hypothetical protein